MGIDEEEVSAVLSPLWGLRFLLLRIPGVSPRATSYRPSGADT